MWTCEVRHPPCSSKQYKLHDWQVNADDGYVDNDDDDGGDVPTSYDDDNADDDHNIDDNHDDDDNDYDYDDNDGYICTQPYVIFRAAHIAVLDSELFIEKFLVIAVLKYFQWSLG